MLRQKQDSRILKSIINRIILSVAGSIILFFISCKNDIDTINALALGPDRPTVTYTNVSFEYTDTAKLQAKLNTPIAHYFLHKEEPYYEFPVGLEVLFYDNTQQIKSVITSKYAIYKIESEIFEVRDSVVARNIEENQTVETEQMFWSQADKLIYSEVFTKITNEDGVHYGERGFEAAQDLSYYRLIGSKGKVKVKDEE